MKKTNEEVKEIKDTEGTQGLSIYQRLVQVQSKLKAPKSQYNKFGKYHYRNLEDILEALKPLLVEAELLLYIQDGIEVIGTRVYVAAIAKVIDVNSGEEIQVKGYAREEEAKKGMDGSQVTGASSSYARKYALNGLFLIDDTKDADSQEPNREVKKSVATDKPILVNKAQIDTLETLAKQINADLTKTLEFYKVKKISELNVSQFTAIVNKMKKQKDKEASN